MSKYTFKITLYVNTKIMYCIFFMFTLFAWKLPYLTNIQSGRKFVIDSRIFLYPTQRWYLKNIRKQQNIQTEFSEHDIKNENSKKKK